MTPLSVLRRRARATLGGGVFSSEWIYALLVYLLISLVIGSSATGILAILVFIFTGPLYIGLCNYFILRTRRRIRHDNLSAAIEGFRGDIGANVVTGLLVTVFTFLWTLLFIIPGIVKSYSYSMTYYIRCDHPEYTATQAIKESERLMRGNKARLFCLHLSFIGWFIVGALCLGVGVFWVAAYSKAAEAEFYQELVSFDPFYEDNNGDMFSGPDIFNT